MQPQRSYIIRDQGEKTEEEQNVTDGRNERSPLAAKIVFWGRNFISMFFYNTECM